MAAALPYWRLSSFYFFYFALLGAWMPYWNIYLDDRGFSAATIGTLSAITLGTKTIAPSLWSWLAEHTAGHLRFIQLGTFLTMASVGLVLLEPGVELMMGVVFIYSFFWNAVLPQFEAITVKHLADRPAFYSRIRMWGSVGFVVAVVILGRVFDTLHIHYLPWFLLLILLALLVSSLLVPAPSFEKRQPSGSALGKLLAQPTVIVFFIAVALQQVSHGPYYTFYSIHMTDLGYSKTLIGLLWAFGVFAEIGVFLLMNRMLPKFGVKRLFLVALGLSCARWLMIGNLANVLPVAVVAQLLHAASFGLCHAVCIDFVRVRFEAFPALGQALYSGVSFGLGGALGAIISGQLWYLGAEISFTMAALASMLALLLVQLFVSVDQPNTATPGSSSPNEEDQ